MVSKHKESRTKIVVITESKVMEIFCMADDFRRFFDAMMKYAFKSTTVDNACVQADVASPTGNLRCKPGIDDKKTGHRNKPNRMNDAELRGR